MSGTDERAAREEEIVSIPEEEGPPRPRKLAIERVIVADDNGGQRNTLYPMQIGYKKNLAKNLAGITNDIEEPKELSDYFKRIFNTKDSLI